MSEEAKKFEEKMQEQHEALRTIGDAVKEIKSLGAEGKAGASEAKVIAERAEEAIGKIETKNQKLMIEMNNERKKLKEDAELTAKEIKSLQGKVSQLSSAGGAGSLDPAIERKVALIREMKSLRTYAKYAKASPDEFKGLEIEKKYFRSDSNADGGFIMDESHDDRILRPITEISPIRSIATTKVIQGLAENLYIESQDFEAFWTGEGQEFTESNQKFQQPRIPLHGITLLTKTTNKAAMGSKFSFDNMVAEGFRRVRLKIEGAGYTNGNGVDKPTGFMSAKAGLTSYQSPTGDATFTPNDLIHITGQLKEGYDAQYLFNRKTLAAIRQMTFPNGESIWTPGNIGAGVPNMINGERYTLVPDMADIGASTTPVIYGDFLSGYQIIDASMANFLRNPYILNGYVQYTLEGYTGGDVVIKEAMIKLQCGDAA